MNIRESAEIKYHPRLFKAEMVRAILDGRKTMTRRVINPQTPGRIFEKYGCWNSASFEGEWVFPNTGDRLWVRETWGEHILDIGDTRQDRWFVYRADEKQKPSDNQIDMPWKPSISMPRWASRITLEVTTVRVEKLQEIKPEDAIREGYPTDAEKAYGRETYIDWFKELWNSINGKKYPWESNPLVRVEEFKMINPQGVR